MLAVIRLVTIINALAVTSPALGADTLRGPARVIDGDGLEIADRDVRLQGINAPELGTDSGRAARDHLAEIVAGRVVVCTRAPRRDRYRRFLGRCEVDDDDLATRMVRDGYATDWACCSGGEHAADQADAEDARRGLWRVAGALVTPTGCRRP